LNKNIFKQNNLEFDMENKRGQGLSVNAVILIVLGIIVLVILVLGFTIGWDRILPFVSSNNVDNIKTACGVACSTNGEFEFCSVKRELKADDVNLKDVTCNYLEKKQKTFGVEECVSIPCNNIKIVDLESGENLIDKCNLPEDASKTIQGLVGDTLLTETCPSA
jgi:hypothetical protein